MKNAYKVAELLCEVLAIFAVTLSLIPFHYENWSLLDAALGLGVTFAAMAGFLARNKDDGGLLVAGLALIGGLGAANPALHAEWLGNALWRWAAIICIVAILVTARLWPGRPWPRKEKSSLKTENAETLVAQTS